MWLLPKPNWLRVSMILLSYIRFYCLSFASTLSGFSKWYLFMVPIQCNVLSVLEPILSRLIILDSFVKLGMTSIPYSCQTWIPTGVTDFSGWTLKSTSQLIILEFCVQGWPECLDHHWISLLPHVLQMRIYHVTGIHPVKLLLSQGRPIKRCNIM